MINKIDEKALVDSIYQYYTDLGWSEEDKEVASSIISEMILMFMLSSMPLGHKKFPEVLRGLANLIELKNIMMEKKDGN